MSSTVIYALQNHLMMQGIRNVRIYL